MTIKKESCTLTFVNVFMGRYLEQRKADCSGEEIVCLESEVKGTSRERSHEDGRSKESNSDSN